MRDIDVRALRVISLPFAALMHDGWMRMMDAMQVTQDPASHPNLHLFLKQVVGFDMVDDESRPERRPNKHMRTPKEWDNAHNPAYGYYAYYIWANLFVLNKFRESKGYSTFYFRPHAGEAGASRGRVCG